MKLSYRLAFSCLLFPLSGCSVFMAASLPIARPPSALSEGQSMDYVDRHFGYPIAMGADADGSHVEQLQFVDGVPIGWKVARICIHGALDAGTYCLWELVGTTIELANRDFKTYVYYVVYDNEGRIVRAVPSDTPEGRRLAQLGWSKSYVDDLKVNKCKDLRDAYNQRSGKSGRRPSVAVVKPLPNAPDKSPAAAKSSAGYSVERFERVTGNEFAYEFKIVFAETDGVGLAAAQRVKRELRASIDEDYRAACPDARTEAVQIDFPEFAMRGNVVEGRAELTRIAVTALTYDDVTQKGTISVRIGASSFEKARAWVRKNIETIVRDKNIALTTGKVPADKRFFIGTERVLDGNILQIEFETE